MGEMNLLIREANVEDSAGIARVQVDTWRNTYREIVPQHFLDEMDYEQRSEAWKEQLAKGDSYIFVADMDKVVCGFISGGRLREPLVGYDGEIYAVYILPEAQRHGCGRAMMRRMAQVLSEDGLKSMAVWVLEKNPACEFYARLGGKRAAEQEIEIGGAKLVEVAYGGSNLRALAEGH